MRACRTVLPVLLLAVAFTAFGAGTAGAATSASFAFDYAGDVGDNADGPQYDMTLTGAFDDGSGCDSVVMVMVDPAGAVVDVDPQCIDTGTGTGSDDGDYGVNNAPTGMPITYALFDVDASETTTLQGLTEGGPEYMAFLLANGTCLAQDFETETPLAVPAGQGYALCAIGGPEATAPDATDQGATITVSGQGCPPGTATAVLTTAGGETSASVATTGLADPFEIDLTVPADAPDGAASLSVFCGPVDNAVSDTTELAIFVGSLVTEPTPVTPVTPAQPIAIVPAFTG